MADCGRFVGKPMQSLFARFIFAFLCDARQACPELMSPKTRPEAVWKDEYR